MIAFGLEPCCHVTPRPRIMVGHDNPVPEKVPEPTFSDVLDRNVRLKETNRIWDLVVQAAHGTVTAAPASYQPPVEAVTLYAEAPRLANVSIGPQVVWQDFNIVDIVTDIVPPQPMSALEISNRGPLPYTQPSDGSLWREFYEKGFSCNPLDVKGNSASRIYAPGSQTYYR